MKQRIISFVAVFLVLTMVLTQTVFAQGTLTVSSVSGKSGDHVTVEIRLDSDDVCSGNFNICFDSTCLQLIDAVRADGNWLGYVNQTGDGTVRVSFAQTTVLKEAVLCILTFRLTADTPVGGSKITLSNVRLYDENSNAVASNVILGTVSRQCAYFHLDCADTVENQSVRVEVSLDGGILPAGGNFSVTFDPAVLQPTAVLALEGLSGAQISSNLDEAGVVRVSFAGSQEIAGGRLCAVIFRAVGAADDGSVLTLTDVRAYDEDSQLVDVMVSSGTVQIVLPTEKDPKLWVVGGALNEDGTADVSLLLQGRGIVCGGNFSLQYDSRMTVEATAGSGVEIYSGEGELRFSWASATPALEELTLATLHFSNAVVSELNFGSDVRLYDSDSNTPIPVVDIRSGTISTVDRVIAVLDSAQIETSEGISTVTVNVDLADVCFYSENPTSTVTPALAVYENGQLKGLTMEHDVALNNGILETSLNVQTRGTVTEYKVLLLSEAESPLPLCGVMTGND